MNYQALTLQVLVKEAMARKLAIDFGTILEAVDHLAPAVRHLAANWRRFRPEHLRRVAKVHSKIPAALGYAIAAPSGRRLEAALKTLAGHAAGETLGSIVGAAMRSGVRDPAQLRQVRLRERAISRGLAIAGRHIGGGSVVIPERAQDIARLLRRTFRKRPTTAWGRFAEGLREGGGEA